MARNRKNRDKSASQTTDTIDIPEDEQWRIIQQSGILKQIPTDSKAAKTDEGAEDDEEGLSPFAEEVFNAMMLIIPMSFMLLLMDMYVACYLQTASKLTNGPHSLVHFQYGRQPDYFTIFKDRLLPGVPSEFAIMLTTAQHSQVAPISHLGIHLLL